MQELSLNILDIAENSIKAGAALITVELVYCTNADLLRIVIHDDGCGMTPEQLQKVTDPFYTTRTTRRVGMGLPLLQMAARLSGGDVAMESTVGKGTRVEALFGFSHIDRMPMGNLSETMTTLIAANPDRDFLLRFAYDGAGFTADTREFRRVLGEEISLAEPEVLCFIGDYIREHMAECCPDPGIL